LQVCGALQRHNKLLFSLFIAYEYGRSILLQMFDVSLRMKDIVRRVIAVGHKRCHYEAVRHGPDERPGQVLLAI